MAADGSDPSVKALTRGPAADSVDGKRGIVIKNILMITTGGTIASVNTDRGLAPGLQADEILGRVPSIRSYCNVGVLPLFHIDSTDIGPEHWLGMARAVRERYDEYDGFVILHGTDTMAYTSAALSYLLQGIAKPVVLTGAQRPAGHEASDANRNLADSFVYAADDEAFGVCLVFGGKVIAGTRARKIRTKSFDAFSTIDYPELAMIHNGRIVRLIREPKPAPPPEFYDRLEPAVFVLKLTPGVDPQLFGCLKERYRALVIESFGVGGVPCGGNGAFLEALDDWTRSGRLLVMTTQVPHEGSDMGLYEVGVRVRERFELIEAYNMTPEAIVAKVMWVLANASGFDEMKRLFYTPVNHDLLF